MKYGEADPGGVTSSLLHFTEVLKSYLGKLVCK